jgi:hypothetical protein
MRFTVDISGAPGKAENWRDNHHLRIAIGCRSDIDVKIALEYWPLSVFKPQLL